MSGRKVSPFFASLWQWFSQRLEGLTTRRQLFLLCLVISAFEERRLHERISDFSLWCGLEVIWWAFLAPVISPFGLVSLYIPSLNPAVFVWRHLCLTLLAASVVWLFPVGRVQRWFGNFDAFNKGTKHLPLVLRGIAEGLDALNKRLFGRQKTGGWA